MKSRKGITLIALVITIIVLLILAGVSISLVIGDNGVLTQATNAVSENRKATAKEDVELAWAGATSKYWEDWANNSATVADLDFYQDELESKETSGGIITSVSEGEDEGTYEIGYTANDQGKDYEFLIDENGKATELSTEIAVEITPNGSSSSLMSNNTTQGQIAALYGQPISYTPTNKLTNIATSNTWRIFYIDTEGIFGNKGEVFLRMDHDGNRKGMYEVNTNSTITSTSKELKRMAKLNPLWADGSKTVEIKSSWQCSKDISYLYDEDVWGIYANQTYAKYAIGGVPAEVWVESYNSFKTNRLSQTTLLDRSFTGNGYQFGNPASNCYGVSNLSGSNQMYCPSSQEYFWLASPGNYNDGRYICMINGWHGCVGMSPTYFQNSCCFCPMVSLKSTESSGYEIVWDTSTNQYKFQEKTN